MSLIRHCIIDTTTNLVVNIIEYETEQTGVPPGLEEHLLCVKSDTGQMGGTSADGVITNLPEPDPIQMGGTSADGVITNLPEPDPIILGAA